MSHAAIYQTSVDSECSFLLFMFVWYEPTVSRLWMWCFLLKSSRIMLLYQSKDQCWNSFCRKKKCLRSAFMRCLPQQNEFQNERIGLIWIKQQTFYISVQSLAEKLLLCLFPTPTGCKKDLIWLISCHYQHHKHNSNSNGAITYTSLPAWMEVLLTSMNMDFPLLWWYEIFVDLIVFQW